MDSPIAILPALPNLGRSIPVSVAIHPLGFGAPSVIAATRDYEMLPHVLQPFGDGVAQVVEDHLHEQGVELHLDTRVSGFEGDGRVERVVVEDSEFAPADIVGVGVGGEPNVSPAETAGVELGRTGAIATDEYGCTNDEDIYRRATAEARHIATGEPDYVPLA